MSAACPPAGLRKGQWAHEEDQTLLSMYMRDGIHDWKKICKRIPGRTAKQCRERWTYHLNPAVKKGNWTPEEDKIIVETHQA